MRGLGEGIAFAGLCIAAATLEVFDKNASGLWFIVLIWVICTDWGQKDAKNGD